MPYILTAVILLLSHQEPALAPTGWGRPPSMGIARARHTATLLPSGRVLVVGGQGGGSLSHVEVFDPFQRAWYGASPLASARSGHTATLLQSGRVLVVGGRSTSGRALASAELYDPATDTWAATGTLSGGRQHHTATLLQSGRVLVVGGADDHGHLTTAEVYDPATGTWTATGSMVQSRELATAALLPSGRVLVVGGRNPSGPLSSAEVYDPASGTWNAAGWLTLARHDHTLTLLPSGRVLAAGGMTPNGPTLGAEVYDPATGLWTVTGSMRDGRAVHTATLLPSGHVLVAGGEGPGGTFLSGTEVYDPATGTWAVTAALSHARFLHTATLLPSGRVLVLGGTGGDGPTTAAELYEPGFASWTRTADMAEGRWGHRAVLLPSGRVLVSGGHNTTGYLRSSALYDPVQGSWDSTGALAQVRQFHTLTMLASGRALAAGGRNTEGLLSSVEQYDPASGLWTGTGSLAQGRDSHTATLLSSGQVLVAGGNARGSLSSAEVYDPATGTWSATGPLASARYSHTATLLKSGKVLVVGGLSVSPLSSAELYDPATGTWSATGPLSQARYLHTATLLPSGQVLVVGGIGPTSNMTSAEVYDPATGTWSSAGALSRGRFAHTATLLPWGRVLVMGGDDSGANMTTEVYDPATATWTVTAQAAEVRSYTTATLLPSGRVLLAGGYLGLTSAEVYDDTGAAPQGLPVLESVTPGGTLEVGWDFTVQGSRLRGSPEAGPLLRLVSLEGGVFDTLPMRGFSSTQVASHVPRLPPGPYLLFVTVNGMTSSTGVHLTRDLTPPDTVFSSVPASPSNLASPTFAFGSSEPGSSFECRLDGAAGFTPCGSPYTTPSPLSEGARTLEVRARDFDGNVDATPASYSWQVDLTAPDTQLFGAVPPRTTRLASARFTFTSQDASATFECRLHGQDFSPCSSPIDYPALYEGPQHFEVRARDAADNVDPTPDSHHWTVDVTRPDTAFTSTPPSLTAQGAATFSFSANEPTTGFECNLSGGGFTPCSSPATFRSLSEGVHTLEVRAIDMVGNEDATPAFYAWRVDLTAPETRFVTTPPNASNARTVTFSFEASEAGVSFECALDGAAFTPCTSPMVISGLAEGPHTLQVRSRDAAGRVDATPESYAWQADSQPPGTRIDSLPAHPSHETTATFTFSADEAGASFECRLEGADFAPCTSPLILVELSEGLHHFEVQARDAAGNVDPTPAAYEWRVDATAPAVPVITAPTDGATRVDRLVTFSGTAEPGSTVLLTLDGALAGSPTASEAGTWSFTPTSPLEDGVHTLTAQARDLRGSSDMSAPVRFTVGEPGLPSGGCGCGAGPGDASWMLAGLALLGSALRRRRQPMA